MAAPMLRRDAGAGNADKEDIVIPGQKLCDFDDETKCGEGTYNRNGAIYSTLVGYAEITESSDDSNKITQATARFCKVDIIAVEDSIFEIPFRGILRREDIRATEKDKIEIHKSFKPGDIALCRVISIGDSQSYILSTAENELGVIIATSDAGASLIPISWRQMQCPKTKAVEYRKVAKPNKEHMKALKSQLADGNES